MKCAIERPRRNEEGTILLLVVMVIALVFIIVADATLIARVELEATENADELLISEMALKGGYQIAEAWLREDLTSGDVDTLQDVWANPEGIEQIFNPMEVGAEGPFIQEGGGEEAGFDTEELPQVKIFIEDEDRKWPLNILLKGVEAQQQRRLQGLINVIDGFREETIYDVDSSQAAEYAQLIHEFLKRPEDAQEGRFGPTPRPLTKTGSLLRVTDLALIPGIPPELIFDQVDDQNQRVAKGLMHFVTIWSDLAVNVNTAPKAVLRGLFSRSEASVGDDIFVYRERAYEEAAREEDIERTTGEAGEEEEEEGGGGGVFQEVDDVQREVRTVTTKLFNESRTMMTVKSSTFSVWIEMRMGPHGPRHLRRYVVRRDGPQIRIILAENVAYPWFREPTEAEIAAEAERFEFR